jgi:HMG (high mobility group) box
LVRSWLSLYYLLPITSHLARTVLEQQHEHVPVVVQLDYEQVPHGRKSTAAATFEYKKKPMAARAAAAVPKEGRIRKSPDAPKRFKSSYILFFMAKQADIKKDLGEGANVSAVSKKSAELWKNLSREERAVWEEKAAEDKARYNTEKVQYTGPWQVPWKRRKKDPSAPKRPMR